MAVAPVVDSAPEAEAAPDAESTDPPRVRIRTVSRAEATKAGVNGLAFTVADAGGAAGTPLSVRVDYSAFASAYGGDYGSRLRLVELPACALTTPDRAECRAATPVRSDNHVGRRQVTGEIAPAADGAATDPGAEGTAEAAPTVLAVQAGASGAGGSFGATDLSPAGSWSAGGSSGDFTYSVPLRVPPAQAGSAPKLGLGYSSGTVDGRTSATNNQASTVGDGWELSAGGFIERRYKACSEDLGGNQGERKTGDLCWATDNAVLNLNGITAKLVKDSETGRWHPEHDDGSRIERLTGAHNGDDNGEYWKVTATDGTQYFLGRNRLPGWQEGKPETHSVQTVPVHGNNSGEPCHAGDFDSAWCQQGYRWKLDYVVDPDGNVTTYYYAPETNRYGRNQDANKQTSYTAAANLRRIEYGLRADAVYAPAPARVWFDLAERCLPTQDFACEPDQLDEDTADRWPDVPSDRICAAGETCDNQHSPAFFTRKRLVKVRTQVREHTDGEPRWRDVDSWTLRHQFPDTGDGLSPALWLAGITHTGLAGGEQSLPEMTFHGRALHNRVDTGDDNLPPITRFRIQRVVNESGGVTEVEYSDHECVAGENMPDSPEHNDMRCFPAWWIPEFGYERQRGWFHKYVVTAVTEDARTNGSQLKKTFYDYKGGAAWHFDDAVFTDMEYRTWSQWRGYGLVRTTVGEPGTTQSVSEERYLRGMDGDRLPDGGTRSVEVTDSEGGTVTDQEQLAGFVRETMQYDGDELVSSSIKDPWVHGPTASSGDDEAYLTDTAAVRGRTLLEDGSWRRTEINNTFDDYGNTIRVEDLGDTAVDGDETCSRTTYLHNDEAWIHTRHSEIRVVGLPCSAGEGDDEDLISDTRFFYDGRAFGEAPVAGNLTRSERWTGAEYQLSERTTYDDLGRAVEVENALGETLSTSYQPGPGFPLRTITKTNPAGHTSTTTLDPARGQPVSEVGYSGERADIAYDPLGRVVRTWAPGRSKADGDSPNSEFAYEYRVDGPTVVTTRELRGDGEYNTSYTLYDGMLRERQNQIPAVSGGRVVTGWFYDSRGNKHKVNGAFYNENPPEPSVLGVLDNAVPNQTVTEFDAQGRETEVIQRKLGVEQWRTSSTYGGDHVSVVPPEGGTTTTVFKDVRGEVVERRQHHGRSPDTDYDSTHYDYDPAGRLVSMTTPDGSEWGYSYDVLGRKVAAHDPDSGTTRYTYDELDRLISSTDARGATLRTEYDVLGRTVAEYERSGPDAPEVKTASWSYDGLRDGLLDESTRWVDGKAYTERVEWYDEALRPTRQSISVPESEGALAGTYTFRTSYNAYTGDVTSETHPAAGGLSAEIVYHRYNELGLPTKTYGLETYAQEHLYSKYGETLRLTRGDGANTVYTSMFYEEGTRRLDEVDIQRNSAEGAYIAKRSYDYDPDGNITRVADSPPGAVGDVQCFEYDYLERLERAFTPGNGDCAQEPSVETLGGAAPYWHDYSYDLSGNRTEEVQHTAEGEVVRTYEYGGADGSQPHTLRSVTETGPDGTSEDTYGYDAAGNMTSRNVAGSPQEIEWDAAGRTSKITMHDGRESEFIHDADGERLLKRESGITTLYLRGMELVLQNATGEVTGKRYYDHGGETVAVRSSGDDGGLSFVLPDHQGTNSIAVDAETLAVSQRRQDPFGVPRGEQPESWPDDKGFVGGTKDESGLTNLGARQYEPENGRFTSVDPVLDPNDPQQMNGYAYANNSPVTNSDPNGLYWKTVTVARLVQVTIHLRVEVWFTPFIPKIYHIRISFLAVQYFTYRVWVDPPKRRQSRDAHQEALREAGMSEQEYQAAKQAAADKRSWMEVALANAGDVAAEVTGIRGIMDNCVNEFNLAKCGLEVASAIPWAKVFRLPKIVAKVKDAVQNTVRWMRRRDKAQANLRKVHEAERRLSRECNSFVPGTTVLLADGTRKPIEEIELGDQVLATDPDTGESTPRAVVATIIGEGEKTLVEIDTADAAGGDTDSIVATAEHPFWTGPIDGWVDADDLTPGSWLRTGSGTWIQVTAVESRTAHQRVHNLTIDVDHTYHVGDWSVLAHNTNDSCDIPGITSPGPYAGQGVDVSRTNHPKARVPERRAVNEEGSRYGCHNCGTKDPGTPRGNWVTDHQPPRSLNVDGNPQKFYPHCASCSSSQGGRLSGRGNG
ncbi:polymorphic toxin-type HINT domain-containing protein [Saccharomonospora iraqiensis]|uniref:polymorphic toxin-type HINT domain-containing protein n=1 Tax=Saccharomonospora iraqiensis TaxID=52698 RepID=UPI0002E48599|nr:polymorphic toxin-type HINT domain-containing protein [Saccharomonospora iraqiensis]